MGFVEYIAARRMPGAVPIGKPLPHVRGADIDELSATLFELGDDMGVGSELKAVLKILRLTTGKCGGRCDQHAKEMDTQGLAWCEANVETIVGWLRAEAKARSWWMFSDIVARQLVLRAIQRSKDSEASAVPFSLTGTRHLLFHMAPFAQNDTWRRNVDHLLRRLWLFNGRRIVAIATGDNMVDPREVELAFGGSVETFTLPNSPKIREVATFVPLLSEVAQYDTDITFYAHSKGVTRPVNDGVSVHPWTDMLYETCLDYYPVAFNILQRYPIAGSMKKVGHGFRGSKSTWHYSGTFFWFRNRDVFSRNWRTIDMQWWGTEAWPGLMFRPDEAGCIFHSGTVPSLDLYAMTYLTTTVLPALNKWRTEHAWQRLTREVMAV